MGTWDVSRVTDMSELFLDRRDWEGDPGLGKWDTSSVASIKSMFSGCRELKVCDVGRWNVSSVANMAAAFASKDLLYFGSPTAYPYLRPMTRYLCAGVGVVVRILINILAGRECACVCV